MYYVGYGYLREGTRLVGHVPVYKGTMQTCVRGGDAAFGQIIVVACYSFATRRWCEVVTMTTRTSCHAPSSSTVCLSGRTIHSTCSTRPAPPAHPRSDHARSASSSHLYRTQHIIHSLSLSCTMDHRNFIHRLAFKTPANTQDPPLPLR